MARRAPPLPLTQRAVFADEQVEMGAFLVGKFQKDLLALGVLEPFAVTFEEFVRAPLAFDPDEQRPFRPLAAPLKNKNVGRDSSCGSFAASSRYRSSRTLR